MPMNMGQECGEVSMQTRRCNENACPGNKQINNLFIFWIINTSFQFVCGAALELAVPHVVWVLDAELCNQILVSLKIAKQL